MQRIVLFIVSFSIWTFLAWPFNPSSGEIGGQDILTGVVVALLVALVMKDVITQPFSRFLNPVRIFWFIAYLFVLAYKVILANFDIAYRVLHPDMPIRPGIVKVKTKLKTASGISALANSITLTQGTLTVEATEDGYLYVHWINIPSVDSEKAAEHIVSRLEGLIKKVFE